MSINNKIMVTMFLAAVTTVSLPMEDKSKPLAIVVKEQPYSYLSLTGLTNSLSNLSDCVATSFDSLNTTITNQISDEAAFKKLGWPLSDESAQQELKRSEEIYKRHNEYFKKYEAYPSYSEDLCAINRRTQYCQRALGALYNNTIANHTDRGKLALHCLLHHKQALNDFDKSKFLYFVTLEQEKIKEDTKKTDQAFEQLTLVPNDNELLNNLFDQTIKQKELVKQNNVKK